MAVLTNTAEGGTDQTAVSTGNSGGTSGDPFTAVALASGGVNRFDVAADASGALGYAIANRGTAANTALQWNEPDHGSVAISFGRYYLTSTATPTSSSATLRFFSSAGTEIVRLYWLTSNKLQLWQPSAFIASSLTTTVLTPGTFYRIEYKLDTTTSGAGAMTLRIYQGDSTTLLEEIGPIALTAAVTSHSRVWFGVHNAINLPTTTDFFYYDNLVANATDWTGPLLVPAVEYDYGSFPKYVLTKKRHL